MAIDGTGTKQDPYVVHDWDELTTAIADDTAYVTVADNVDIDLLEIYPEGIPTTEATITFACKEFDGNGIILRNAYTLVAISGSYPVIDCAATCDALSNINFVNFYINLGNGKNLISSRKSSTPYITVSHSSFKGMLFSSTASSHTIFNKISRFFDCTFNLKATFASGGYINNTTTNFDSCWMRWDTNTRWVSDHNQQTFINTYLEGKFNALANNQHIIDISKAVCSIFNVNLDAGTYTGCDIYGYSGSILCLVNSDKLGTGVSIAGYNAASTPIGVTDSQLKDSTYLPTIFPVIPYDEGGDEDDV